MAKTKQASQSIKDDHTPKDWAIELKWARAIIVVLVSVVGFFAVAWIKGMELRIAQAETATQQIKLAAQADKARVEGMDVQLRTLTAVLDRIEDSVRSIDNRLTKREVADDYRFKK